MANVGYTLMTEQAGPKDLVRWAARAEDTGFDLLVSSDHYFPWLDEQGHAPNAWVTLGAVAQATERAELMTYVTCPTMRYHPAVVAQQAATLALLSDNRFTLGLGAGGLGFVSFGPAGQALGLRRAVHLHDQPGRLQHEEPDPLRLCSRSLGSSRCPKGRLEHHYMRKRRETIMANESGPKAGVEGVVEDVKGRAKEGVGAVSGERVGEAGRRGPAGQGGRAA